MKRRARWEPWWEPIAWPKPHRVIAFIVGALGFMFLSWAIPDWRVIAGIILILLAERIRDDWRF